VFTARYGLSLYVTQILFFFKWLRFAVAYSVWAFSLRVSESAILNFCSQLLIDNEQKNFTHILKVFWDPEF